MDWLDLVLAALPYVLGVSIIGTFVVKVLNFVKELSDVLVSVVNALEDKALTKEEIAKIAQEAKEIVDAAKAFAKK